MKTKHFLLTLSAILLLVGLQAQSRLVLNGGIINIRNGAFLVVDNPAPNAITRNSGHMISEGENNRLKWNVGNTAGTYSVPFGYNGTFIPVSFTKNSGSGNGSFVLSTYHTLWKNSDHLPAGIPNMTGQMPDHSAWAIDRFWQVSAESYTTKPSLTNLTLSYVDAEHQAAGNNIIETYLSAQQYNEAEVGWDEVQPGAFTNTSANTVTIASVPDNAFFKWWTLTDQLYPLPVQLLSFAAQANDKKVWLQWKVTGEKPGTQYQLQRKKQDGVFVSIATIDGNAVAGEKTYLHEDAAPFTGQSFYRLRIQQNGGNFSYSSVRAVWLKEEERMTLFPNPVVNNSLTIQLSAALQKEGAVVLFNQAGVHVATYFINKIQEQIRIVLPATLPPGTYICQWQTSTSKSHQTFVLQ